MKTYQIFYTGNNFGLKVKLRQNTQRVQANSHREAVEKYYSKFFSQSYLPYEDGSILDADGNLVCGANDNEIKFDGGYIRAIQVQE